VTRPDLRPVPTPPTFASGFDALGDWREQLGRRVDTLTRYLSEHELADGPTRQQLDLLRERIGQDRLVVAFVAEFSRGKSELINAIFFADAGRRILPATPGRTTMCPVELAWDADEQPSLALLPIETRLDGLSLADLRGHTTRWTRLPLATDSPDQLAERLTEVMRTRQVSKEQAVALGFWDDQRPDDNPPVDAAGRVEIPAWRHALINYPHPLLKQGLVVLDTPGLNAIGAEPELTLGLLPSAHAVVFVLGADTGVTKSDLAIWRDHLGAQAANSFVVLNKIDALIDPLATPEQVRAQIDAQQRATAATLGIDAARVFPLSARQALAARVAGDAEGLATSRLPALETALGEELLPQRSAVLEIAVRDAAQAIERQVARRIADQRRQLAEQTLELRGLRGKSAAKVRMMIERVDAETAEFEQSTARLQAMRAVHARMLKDATVGLSSDRLRDEVGVAQEAMTAGILNLGARRAFGTLCQRLHTLLGAGEKHASEIRDMLDATYAKLNAEFGFSLSVAPALSFQRFQAELSLIETSYSRYLGLTASLRLSQPKFMDQFRRMLLSKLRVVFENASAELELWNKAASAQVESQLRERRRGFRRRREALERIQSAASELETRLVEIEAQDQRLGETQLRTLELTTHLCAHAETAPTIDGIPKITIDLPLDDEPPPMMLRHA
jgi:hypothetical protein